MHEKLPQHIYCEEDACLAYLRAIETAILTLSTNRAATDRLLSDLCDAYEWCNKVDRQIQDVETAKHDDG